MIRLKRGAYGVLSPHVEDVLLHAESALTKLAPNEIRAWHYNEVVKLALASMDWTPPSHEAFRQTAEDFRFAVDTGIATKERFGYVSRDSGGSETEQFKVVLRRWIQSDQIEFNLDPPIKIPCSFGASIDAVKHAVLRAPYFDPRGRKPESVAINYGTSKIVETSISWWFREMFPTLWLPASNEHQFNRAAHDDFRLVIAGIVHPMDVKKSIDGWFKNGEWKSPSNTIFLLAVANDRDVTDCDFVGWCTPSMFETGLTATSARPLVQLFFRLNCAACGDDYDTYKQLFGKRQTVHQ